MENRLIFRNVDGMSGGYNYPETAFPTFDRGGVPVDFRRGVSGNVGDIRRQLDGTVGLPPKNRRMPDLSKGWVKNLGDPVVKEGKRVRRSTEDVLARLANDSFAVEEFVDFTSAESPFDSDAFLFE